MDLNKTVRSALKNAKLYNFENLQISKSYFKALRQVIEEFVKEITVLSAANCQNNRLHDSDLWQVLDSKRQSEIIDSFHLKNHEKGNFSIGRTKRNDNDCKKSVAEAGLKRKLGIEKYLEEQKLPQSKNAKARD